MSQVIDKSGMWANISIQCKFLTFFTKTCCKRRLIFAESFADTLYLWDEKLIFFCFRGPPGLLSVLGPLERYVMPSLDAALLINSRAGADLGRMSVINPMARHSTIWTTERLIHHTQMGFDPPFDWKRQITVWKMDAEWTKPPRLDWKIDLSGALLSTCCTGDNQHGLTVYTHTHTHTLPPALKEYFCPKAIRIIFFNVGSP